MYKIVETGQLITSKQTQKTLDELESKGVIEKVSGEKELKQEHETKERKQRVSRKNKD